jgi:hypothetical protein
VRSSWLMLARNCDLPTQSRREWRSRWDRCCCMGCGIVPRKIIHRRGRVFLFARRQHVRHRYARCCRPAGVVRPHHVQRDRIGSWEVSRPTVSRHSSWEADEQSGAIRRGVGGAKGRDRGEYEPTKHAPNSEPGKRDTGRWLVYGNSLPSLPEVGEPYAGKPHVRICAGGREVTRVPTANIMVVRARAAPNPRLRYPQFQCSGLDRRRLLSGRYQHL